MQHHLVTITLIVVSYYTNFTRIGVVVFAIFDAADVLLHLQSHLGSPSFSQNLSVCLLESSRIYSVRTLYTYEVHILVNHSHVDLHPSLSPDRCNDQYHYRTTKIPSHSLGTGKWVFCFRNSFKTHLLNLLCAIRDPPSLLVNVLSIHRIHSQKYFKAHLPPTI